MLTNVGAIEICAEDRDIHTTNKRRQVGVFRLMEPNCLIRAKNNNTSWKVTVIENTVIEKRIPFLVRLTTSQ